MFQKFEITNILKNIISEKPQAKATINGISSHQQIKGAVYFYQTTSGVIVAAKIKGLPHETGVCKSGVFGFHIHSGGSCSGTLESPLANTNGHLDKFECPHPHHAGDMPPLFENSGEAFMVFLTNRIAVHDIIGRTVVIHSSPDDFHSQPAGNSGEKIACGEIKVII